MSRAPWEQRLDVKVLKFKLARIKQVGTLFIHCGSALPRLGVCLAERPGHDTYDDQSYDGVTADFALVLQDLLSGAI